MTNVKDKVLSIVVPAFNVEDYLDRAVESVIAARCANDVELIVVDDGSTDSTGKIADYWSAKHPEVVRVVHKTNGHYGTAVNRGIEEATGSFFKIMDGDDYFCSAGLDALVEYLKSEPSTDLTITDFDIVGDMNNVQRHVSFDIPQRTLLNLAETPIDPVNMHAVTFRTELLKRMEQRLDGGVPYTDVEFILYPMVSVKNAYYLPVVVYKYFFGREDQSCNITQMKRNIDAHRFVVDQLIAWYEDIDWTASMNRTYIEKRIGVMAAMTSDIYLLQSDTRRGKELLLSLEERISKHEKLRKHCTSQKLLLLRKTNYHIYGPLSFACRVHHRMKSLLDAY